MASIWIDFLKDCISKEDLDTYSNIYYIGSCSNFPETKLEEAIKNCELSDFIINYDPDVNYDIFHFYIAMNDLNQYLIIIYDPFELFDSSHIYKIVDDFRENLLTIPTIEKIK